MPDLFGWGKRAVVIGGGTGAPVSIRALLSLGYETSAIVAMADDGGSTGILRQMPNVTAPGDVRKCLAAFADTSDPLIMRRERIFRMRLNSQGNHAVGNLILGGYERATGSFKEAISRCEALLHAKGRVIPSTFDKVTVAGIDVQGNTVTGQYDICHSAEPMSHVFLRAEGEVCPNPEALSAIAEADVCVIGPGSLYTSIIPNLLVPEIADAIQASKAHVVFVCPLADAQGETRGMDVQDCVDALNRHGLADRIDAVIINKPRFGTGQRTYLAHDRVFDVNVYSVEYTDEMLDNLADHGTVPYLASLADTERLTWHNPVALRDAIREVEGTCRLL